MKKIAAILFAMVVSFGVMAGNYRLDEASVDAMIAQADDVTMTEVEAYETMSMNAFASSSEMLADSQTKGGYLLRAFFCGSFALHRYYMGAEGAKYFFFYFCVPVVGGLDACVDFWAVVFGKDINDYKNNDKLIVWLGN